jgi:AraC-like DNA-binding protein
MMPFLLKRSSSSRFIFTRYLFSSKGGVCTIRGAAEKVCEQAVAYNNQQLKMTDIAQELHYHADYLTRCMHKTMGVGPLQYLNEVRLQKANQLMAAST